MIINRIYETQDFLSLWLVSFLVALRTYQHPSIRNCDIISFAAIRKVPTLIITRLTTARTPLEAYILCGFFTQIGQ